MAHTKSAFDIEIDFKIFGATPLLLLKIKYFIFTLFLNFLLNVLILFKLFSFEALSEIQISNLSFLNFV